MASPGQLWHNFSSFHPVQVLVTLLYLDRVRPKGRTKMLLQFEKFKKQ
jgi:hypothetical protein